MASGRFMTLNLRFTYAALAAFFVVTRFAPLAALRTGFLVFAPLAFASAGVCPFVAATSRSIASVRSDSTLGGRTAFTVIPRGASSRAADRTRPRSPALLAAYAA